MRLTHRLSGTVAAALVAAAALVGLSSAPAGAAYCSGSGVNVVVDRGALGGGVQKACDPDGGGETADKVFPHAGFTLSYAARQPGFVCRVDGAPSSDPCVNASPSNAYWGLYWSDGRSGTWTYASTGVGGLKVPDGGFVAFSWQNGGDEDKPGAAPVNQAPAPSASPTKKPTAQPSKAPSKAPSSTPRPGTPRASASASKAAQSAQAKASAKASARASARASASASASPSPSPSATSSESADAVAGDDPTLTPLDGSSAGGGTGTQEADGVPAWVPGAGVVGLMAAAGGVAWWRKRPLT